MLVFVLNYEMYNPLEGVRKGERELLLVTWDLLKLLLR